jgi:hypothetical protein
MDNTTDISSSILSTSNTFSDNVGKTSATTWILIILVLAFFGFNIFIYLAKGTQNVADIFGSFFGPFIQKILIALGITTSQVIDVTAEGTKSVVNKTADTIDAGLTDIQNITPNKFDQNTINKTLNSNQFHQNSSNYEADDTTSSIQGRGKSGYCYIGEDRGFRSCVQVGANDTCMSGDIFPTKDICVNPNLRV